MATAWAPERRDIIWIDCNPQAGREMKDLHPLLVLSPRIFNERTGIVIGLFPPAAGGGYAEYVSVHESHALPVPAGFTFTEAAALPETYFTVWHNVFQRGGLKPGETLLVHGGSSGIGTTAIQLASAFGARVIATAGSAEGPTCRAAARPTSPS